MKTGIRSVPGLVNLDDDLDRGKPELRLRVDRIEAMLAGVNTQEIATTVQTALRGTEASKYRIGEDEYDITVRLAPEARGSLDDLGDLTVPDEDGIPIPLRTLVELEPGVGPATVNRVDLKRVVTIDGDVVRAPGRTEDSVRQEVAARLTKIDFPPGYRWSFAGSNQDEQESQAFLQRAFVIAVLLISLVLVTQFDFPHPADHDHGLCASVAHRSFVGLDHHGDAVRHHHDGDRSDLARRHRGHNAIVLCDFIRQLRESGMEKTKAVIEAGIIRLRPVLLTAVTTVLGLIPLTLGINIDFFRGALSPGGQSSQWWGPMGVAVIFGLTVATVLTLVVVPVTYHSLDSLSDALTTIPDRWRRRRADRSGSGLHEGAEIQAREVREAR